MSFNVSKCKCMLISHKTHMNYPSLTLSGEYLEIVQCYKHLGIVLSSNLSWLTHIDSICIKVGKLLGLLHRQFSANANSHTLTKLYLSLIRPRLEYGAQVWHLYSSKNIQAIENIQKFALSICSKKCNLSYWELLDMLDLPQKLQVSRFSGRSSTL